MRAGEAMALAERQVNLTTAANMLAVSRTKLWTMVRAGEIESSPDLLDKRQRLIPVREVERLLSERGTSIRSNDDSPGRRRFISDGSVSNPDAVGSDRIKEWVRETWRR
jgi:hypothetical protein